VRFYRLTEKAFDASSAIAFKRWGDGLMAQAEALEASEDRQEGEKGGR